MGVATTTDGGRILGPTGAERRGPEENVRMTHTDQPTTPLPDGIVIRALQAGDDTELREMHAALREAMLLENSERPVWSLEVLTGMIRQPDDDIEFDAWVAVDADGATPSVYG